MRQEFIFLKDWVLTGFSDVKKALPIDMAAKPSKVWTVPTMNHNTPPDLPFEPIHGQTAWAEDAMHDWTWRNGKFTYRSRAVNGPTWILVEYED